MEFITEDEDTYLHYVKRNNYITKIVQENERIKNEKLRDSIKKDNKILQLKDRVKELEAMINKDKENYKSNKNKLTNLKILINEYKY